MIDSMSNPLMTTAHATGRIRSYQFVVGMMNILILPISYVFLKLGYGPVSVFLISLCMSVMCFVARMIVVKQLICFPVIRYVVRVLMPCMAVVFLAVIPPYVVYLNMEEGVWSFIIVCVISLLSTLLLIYAIGLDKREKTFVLSNIGTRLHI